MTNQNPFDNNDIDNLMELIPHVNALNSDCGWPVVYAQIKHEMELIEQKWRDGESGEEYEKSQAKHSGFQAVIDFVNKITAEVKAMQASSDVIDKLSEDTNNGY